jgi:7-keto-8-aminopelargonate synthetase-like enzyme
MRREPERIERLWANTKHLWQGLESINVDKGKSQSPVVPIHIGDDLNTFRVCHRLQDEGVFINPIVSPAVAPGEALIRLSVMSTHTFEQIDRAVDAIDRVLTKCDVDRRITANNQTTQGVHST